MNKSSIDLERNLPIGSEIFLDHVGHFVPSAERASEALVQAGFHPTPISIQKNEGPDVASRLSGTGNVTAMLKHGYIEVLFKTADTALGQEFDEAISKHAGVHLAAFAVSDAKAKSQQLLDAGFRVRPIVELKRPIETETGEAEAAFTVARVERGEMSEGRMQYLTHHSEEAVWQKRWLNHANGAEGLLDIVIAVEDAAEAAMRFGKFLGRDPELAEIGKAVHLERGGVQLVDRKTFEQMFGPVPQLPYIGIYALRIASLEKCENLLATNDLKPTRHGKVLFTRFPEALGCGAWLFVESENDLPWRAS